MDNLKRRRGVVTFLRTIYYFLKYVKRPCETDINGDVIRYDFRTAWEIARLIA